MATLTATPSGPNKVLGTLTLDTNASTITIQNPYAGCRGIQLICKDSAWLWSDASAGTYQFVAAGQPLTLEIPVTILPGSSYVIYAKVASSTAALVVSTV